MGSTSITLVFGMKALGYALHHQSLHLCVCDNCDDNVYSTTHCFLLQVTSVSTGGHPLVSVYEHSDIISCVDMGEDGKTLVTASLDTSVCIWDCSGARGDDEDEEEGKRNRWNNIITKKLKKLSFASNNNSDSNNFLRLRNVLIGHDDAVLCVAVSTDLGIIVTGSQDCTSIEYTTDGKYLRTLYHNNPVTLVKIASFGWIVTYSSAIATQQDSSSNNNSFNNNSNQSIGAVLSLYYVNGTLEGQVQEGVAGITHMLVTRDSKWLVTGHENGSICVRSMFHQLALVHTFEGTRSRIRSLTFIMPTQEELATFGGACTQATNSKEKYVVAGLQDGKIIIFLWDTSLWSTQYP